MPDPYQAPDQLDPQVLDAIVQRLEERGENARFQAMIAAYLAEIPPDRPLSVLDLGCGTGVVTRRLSEHLHPEAEVHGLDVSERFLAEARRLAPESRIQWRLSSGTELPYPDASFDWVVLHTVLSHLPDPLATLREVRRTLRAGGRAVLFDADYASTTFAYPDLALMRETDFRLLAAVAANLDVCRQLPRYLAEAGLSLDRHVGDVLSEAGRGDYYLSSVQGFAKLIPALGILSAEEGRAWVEHMLAAHEAGTFFASCTYYTFYASRPST
ncbi:MAG TPA: hypothetical protein DEA08_30235 [Planctomycetes bacterium]|nr:hypothetical protein [Planctomycetota bacterium]